VVYPEYDVESIKYSRIEIPLWFISSLCLKNNNIPVRVLLQVRDQAVELPRSENPPEVWTTSSEIEEDEDIDPVHPGPSSSRRQRISNVGKRIKGVYLWAMNSSSTSSE